MNFKQKRDIRNMDVLNEEVRKHLYLCVMVQSGRLFLRFNLQGVDFLKRQDSQPKLACHSLNQVCQELRPLTKAAGEFIKTQGRCR